jgi:hypothetical protein
MLSATRELYLRQLNTVTYPNSLNCISNLYDTCCATRCLNQGSSRFLGGVRVAHNYGFLSCLFVFVCLRSDFFYYFNFVSYTASLHKHHGWLIVRHYNCGYHAYQIYLCVCKRFWFILF